MLNHANRLLSRSLSAPRCVLFAVLPLTGLVLCLASMSVSAAQAAVLWAASPAKSATEDWANVAAEPGRITTVPFASMPGGKAYRVEIREGDNPGGYGERSELAMGNPEKAGVPVFHEGDDVWIAFQFRMQSPYPIGEDHNAWNLIFQLHQSGGSSPPPFEINVERNRFIASHRPSEAQTGGEVGSWPAEVDKWSRFLLHVKFSSDAAVGSVEMFGELNEDKSGMVALLANTKMPTIFKQGGVPVPTHARIGTYRGNWAPRPTAVTYYAGFTVAAERASAETSAFGSGESPGQPGSVLSGVQPPIASIAKTSVAGASAGKSPLTQPPSKELGSTGRSRRSSGVSRPTALRSRGPLPRRPAPRVWLRLQKRVATAAIARRTRLASIVGGIASSAKLAGWRVVVEVYRDHAWRVLGVATVDRRDRFALVEQLPPGASELRAYVADIGHSRVIKTSGR
jgi:hypothetical protein